MGRSPIITVCASVCVLFASATVTRAASVIVNGSFEQGGFSTFSHGTHHVVPAGSADLTGWRVTNDNIEVIGTLWQDSHGSRSLDLDGTSAGEIQQDFASVIGHTYLVTFDLAGNFEGGSTTKNLRVSAAAASQDFSFTRPTGWSFANMQWAAQSWSFVATAATTTLTFRSLSPESPTSFWGPALDNVVVTDLSAPVPLPSTALASLPLLTLLASRRRNPTRPPATA